MLKVTSKLTLNSYQSVQENYEDTLLVTFDVLNLYTNTPHTFGLEALNYWLENHPESLHARFNKEFVLECAKFILQSNNMKFNNEYYNQIIGTAIGTIFAPTYANLLMGYFEIELYSVCTFKYGELLAEYIKENWKGFFDDCYTVLRRSQISPEELLLTINSMNPSIQFTMEYSKDQIPFLDILIKRNENGIWMDLYHKPTDTQRCLPFTFSHPNHCKRNIPFSLTRRFCTVTENNTEKLKNLENLKLNLSKYHYPNSLINQGFQKALSIPQKHLRKPKKTSNEASLPFITTFNANNPNIYSTIKSSVICLKNNNVSGFHNIN